MEKSMTATKKLQAERKSDFKFRINKSQIADRILKNQNLKN